MNGKKLLGYVVILGLIVLLWLLVTRLLPTFIALATNVVSLLLFLIIAAAAIYGIIRLLKWCFS